MYVVLISALLADVFKVLVLSLYGKIQGHGIKISHNYFLHFQSVLRLGYGLDNWGSISGRSRFSFS
jgi:hypothetical protein